MAESAAKLGFFSELRRALPSQLPVYLARQRWFGGKARTIRAAELVDVVPVPVRGDEHGAFVLIVAVEYAEAEPILSPRRLDPADQPLTMEAEEYLNEQKVVCATDYIVNCGGVIGGAEEWAEIEHPLGALRIPNCVARIINVVTENIPAVHAHAAKRGITPRAAAAEIIRPRIGDE